MTHAGPGVIHRHGGRGQLRGRFDDSFGNEAVVHGSTRMEEDNVRRRSFTNRVGGVGGYFTDLMISPSSSKLLGTKAPASFRAVFLATAVSEAWLAQAPAWPNWTWGRNAADVREADKVPVFGGVRNVQVTSEENMVAQVPMHQHTTGFVILPCLMAWQILYSSVPPI